MTQTCITLRCFATPRHYLRYPIICLCQVSAFVLHAPSHQRLFLLWPWWWWWLLHLLIEMFPRPVSPVFTNGAWPALSISGYARTVAPIERFIITTKFRANDRTPWPLRVPHSRSYREHETCHWLRRDHRIHPRLLISVGWELSDHLCVSYARATSE